MKILELLLAYLLFLWSSFVIADKPCAARQVKDRSVLCVCNATYCDEMTRKAPVRGGFIAYTSSEAGLRFENVEGFLEYSSDDISVVLTIHLSEKYQKIEGFGGAVTDAAGINWKSLSTPLQRFMIDSYFGQNGLQYNMLRVPIGGTDFSTHAYAYNELPENDTKLSNFFLSYEDHNYKIPMIKEIFKRSKNPIHIIASTWSPPLWMKSNHNWTGGGHLLEHYYQTYAKYHLKFLVRYAAHGIKIWGITTTNEPVDGVLPNLNYNCLGWSPENMGIYIVEYLGPALRNSKFIYVKILAVDDLRSAIPKWLDVMIEKYKETLDYIDGIAVHYSWDSGSSAPHMSDVPKKYPGKFVISTEPCEGGSLFQTEKVALGDWSRAVTYINDILLDLNHDVVGWLDWNLCLDTQGGPNWAKNYLDSPIIVFPEKEEFVKQPMFYAVGHFSKFIPRGSVRVKVVERRGFFDSSIDNVAFMTPKGTVVVVMHNNVGIKRRVAVKLSGKHAKLNLAANSITTVEIKYKH